MAKKSFEERKKIIYDLVRDALYVPMKEKELAIFLQVEPEDRPQLKQALEELLKEHAIEITKRGKYKAPENPILEGRFIANEKGFGFIEVEGQEEDYYVPEEYVHTAFHHDKVSFRLLPPSRGRRQEAEIVSVLEHEITQVVGTFEKSKSYGFVIPDDTKIPTDIFIPAGAIGGAVDGHKVVCEISDYGGERRNPEGRIVEILGHRDDPGVDILSIVKAFGIPTEFEKRVLDQAQRVSNPVSEADCAGRLDLRNVQMVTIDGEDAKDLDDAVSLVNSLGEDKGTVEQKDILNPNGWTGINGIFRFKYNGSSERNMDIKQVIGGAVEKTRIISPAQLNFLQEK